MKFLDLQEENKESSAEFVNFYQEIEKSGKYLLGDFLLSFEKEFAKDQQVKHAVCVKNATDALYIVFSILGAESKTIILPQFGAYPTVMAALQAKAKNIIAAPVDERLTLDLRNIDVPENSIIVPVHLFGNQAEMKHIEEIAKRTKSLIVEDCAQSTGVQKFESSIAAIHSFYPTKPLGCRGDGGAILTNDSALEDKCRKARFYGLDEFGYVSSWGFNSRMDEWQAAFLLCKIKHYRNLNMIRQSTAKKYNMFLPNHIVRDENCVYHQYVVLLNERDTVKKLLEEKGIPTMIHYPRMLSDMPFLQDKVQFSACKNIAKHILSLPVGPHIKELDAEKIILSLESLKDYVIDFNAI